MPNIFLGWPLVPRKQRAPIYSSKTPQQLATSARSNTENSLEYTGERHLTTFAPTGSGKGVSVVIPCLLSYSGPMIVIDPKGENFRITARYRQEIGHQIYVLDPFSAQTPIKVGNTRDERIYVGDALNPLDLVRPGSDGADAQIIADSLSVKSSGDHKFWDDSATTLLAGLVHHVATHPKFSRDERNIAEVIKIINFENFSELLSDIIRDDESDDFVRRTLSVYSSITASGQKDGILGTCKAYFNSLNSDAVLNSLSKSTIDLEKIANGDNITIYIVFPSAQLQSHARLLRLWVSTLFRIILRRTSIPNSRTLFILDECAQLGTLEQLRVAVTLLRGFGLQAWMLFQDLSQLTHLYDDWENIVNNCGVVQAFGVGRKLASNPLAQLFSNIRGPELLSLGEFQQALSISGKRSIIANKGDYRKDVAFEGRFDQNPFFKNN